MRVSGVFEGANRARTRYRMISLEHQKFSICHTLRVVLTPAMARDRPSGDGIAPNISGLLERSRTETRAIERDIQQSTVGFMMPRQAGEFSIHGPYDAIQFVPSLYRHLTRFTSESGAQPDRSFTAISKLWRVANHRGTSSSCTRDRFVADLSFYRSARQTGTSPYVSPLRLLYRQTADGKGEHCTFQMRTSLRTRRGVPPAIGIAKMELGVLRSADLGVEIYKISEPSGVTLGCNELLSAGHQIFRQGLIDGLFEYLGSTVSIRTKQHCLAIWCPSKREVLVLIECQPSVCEQMRAVRRQHTDVNTRHRILSEESQHFPVIASGNLGNPTNSSRDAFRGLGNPFQTVAATPSRGLRPAGFPDPQRCK